MQLDHDQAFLRPPYGVRRIGQDRPDIQ